MTDHDVVGGGPAGCSVAVFTARDGLNTVVDDQILERARELEAERAATEPEVSE